VGIEIFGYGTGGVVTGNAEGGAFCAFGAGFVALSALALGLEEVGRERYTFTRRSLQFRQPRRDF
jgi:hypothetical protein